MGVFSVGTYNTPAANTPFPPTVTHLNIFSSATNNSANVVDRFWVTEKTGANPVANLTFRWPDIENSSGMSALNPPRAQPWRYISTVSPTYEAWLRITNTSPTAPVGSTLGTTLSYPQTTAIIAGVADSSKVVISTIQRVFSVLRGVEVPEDDDPGIDDFQPPAPVSVEYKMELLQLNSLLLQLPKISKP